VVVSTQCIDRSVSVAWLTQGYRASAERAAILFFVLNDMGAIDPMYQFALDAYTDLYSLSIDKSQRSPKLEERINNLNEYHTYAVYRSVITTSYRYHRPTRSTCSYASHLLSVPRHNLSSSSRAFRNSAPKIWNSLPPHILQSQTLSSFRRHLKTHYFQSVYPAP